MLYSKAIKYPFIGVQFHPEKNIFEWSEKEPRIPHSRFIKKYRPLNLNSHKIFLQRHAVHVSLYFASHFVNMARRNQHGFQDRYNTNVLLIQTYHV